SHGEPLSATALHAIGGPGVPSLRGPFCGVTQDIRTFLSQEVTRLERVRTVSVIVEGMLLMVGALWLLLNRMSLWSVVAFCEGVFCSLTPTAVWDYYPGLIRVLIPLTIFVLFGLLDLCTEN